MSTDSVVARARERMGKVGVFAAAIGAFAGAPVAKERAFVRALDEAGYGSYWVGQGIGTKDVFVRLGVMLAETGNLVVGTGIANVWAYSPRAMQAASATLAEAYPNRFVHGVGIGHAFQAAREGQPFQPLRQLGQYLDDLAAPPDPSPAGVGSPDVPFPRVVAAIGPKMLHLARERTDGVFPFVQPVEHTALAREILGPDKLLVQHQSVLLTNDREAGYAAAAAVLRRVAEIPAYAASYRRFGYTEAEIAEPSRRLIDAIVAFGDEETVLARVRAHLDAGADHVLVSAVVGTFAEATDQLTRLAPALIEGTK